METTKTDYNIATETRRDLCVGGLLKMPRVAFSMSTTGEHPYFCPMHSQPSIHRVKGGLFLRFSGKKTSEPLGLYSVLSMLN